MIKTMKPKDKKRKRIFLFTFRYQIDRPYYNSFFGFMKAEGYDDAREKLMEKWPKYTIKKLQQKDDNRKVKKKS